MSRKTAERVFTGEVASQGLAAGTIVCYRREIAAATSQGSPEAERMKLEAAIAAASRQLAELMAAGDEIAAEILEFQVALLDDPALFAPALESIARGQPAARAWREALEREIADYRSAEDEAFRARADDLGDLRDRVLALLSTSTHASGAQSQATDTIYVADDLAPSRFLETDWSRTRGVVLANGSAASHVAILARARGVPLLVGLGAAVKEIVDGAEAILDAEAGKLIQFPCGATRADYQVRIAERAATAESDARSLAQPAVTKAGERVQVAVNLDDPRLLDRLDPAHCDGIGLTRSEFLFHQQPADQAGLPDEDRQYQAYRRILDWSQGRPVTIRTLDVGGDKPIPGVTPEQEANPFLGQRGLRLSLARPEIFRVQLRALVRAAARGSLKIMLPMVTQPRELAEARGLLDQVLSELSAEGQEAKRPPLGIMVEVPAAALNIATFDADFFSIGSNDLVQYVTATSRDNASVAELHDPLDPAVLRLIGEVVAQGAASGREVSLCGDMAGDPACLTALLKLGLRSFSVAPAALARVKAEIARHG